MQSNVGTAALFALLWTCSSAFGRDFRSNHDTAQSDRYGAVLHELSATDTGADLGDAKMEDLTESIQGVFQQGPKPQVTIDPVARAPSLKVKYEATPTKALPPKKVDEHKRAVEALQAAIAAAKPKKVVQGIAQTNVKSSKVVNSKPVTAVANNTKLPTSGKVGHINVSVLVPSGNRTLGKQPMKLRVPGKVGHINVTTAKQTLLKEKKKKIIEEAVVSMPMASFALEPKATKKNAERKFPGNATQKAEFEKKAQSLEDQVKALKARLKNASQVLAATKHAANFSKLPTEGKVGHINVSVVAQSVSKQMLTPKGKPLSGQAKQVTKLPVVAQPKQVPAKRLPVKGKVGHINVSAAVAPPNQTQGKQPASAENKTKELEAVAVSLPMAGFALAEPVPVKNKTEHKFPGNATQKAAFEHKEKSLEDEVEKLKARLSNASNSMVPLKPKAVPAATGTFHAHLHHVDDKSPKTFMAPKGPEPMQPINKDKKPKANWPTMASVAAPVALQHVKDVVVPPQKDAIKAQEDNTKKVSMGTTFTGTPAKKVQSVLALEATVERGSAVVDNDAPEQVVPASPVLDWFSAISSWLVSFFSWFTGKPSSPAVSKMPSAPLMAIHTKAHSLVDAKQDSERTAAAAREDNQQIFEVNDAWRELEKEDNVKEDQVHREDVAERQLAETVEQPHKPSKSELDGRHGVAMSGFWKKLEKEDSTIEETVHSDDLVKYAELTQAQDLRVAKESDQLDTGKLKVGEHHSLNHNSDIRIAIHEPWLVRETRDKAVERSVHDEPYLQMLQLAHRHKHK